MSKLYLIPITLLLVLGGHSTASSQDPSPSFATPVAFVKSIVKAEDTLSNEAKGDLNGDGLADWAGVIHRRRPDFGSTDQLYVLLRSAQGGYRLAVQSTEAQIPGMGCCWLEDLSVRNGSIYIQNNAKTCCTMEAATHQFKLQKGEWRLIGVRIYYTDLESTKTTVTEMNLLTDTVRETKGKDARKPTVRRWRKKFARFLLKDFDFLNQFGN
ncbi:MAG: hypothetical protein QOD75_2541 [Blastocatellia bacterium]|jgi:hypothetical protein|nr:hypothetical protein [Blastocatellia bacterium]